MFDEHSNGGLKVVAWTVFVILSVYLCARRKYHSLLWLYYHMRFGRTCTIAIKTLKCKEHVVLIHSSRFIKEYLLRTVTWWKTSHPVWESIRNNFKSQFALCCHNLLTDMILVQSTVIWFLYNYHILLLFLCVSVCVCWDSWSASVCIDESIHLSVCT